MRADAYRPVVLVSDTLIASHADVLAALRDVDGYFSESEALAFHDVVLTFAAPAERALRVVEIGSYMGRSTIAAGLALRARGAGSVVSIDPHAPTGKASYAAEHGDRETFAEFEANVARAGVAGFVIPVRATSEQARAEYDGVPIDVLFIDGSHDEDDVRFDTEAWLPLLAARAVAAYNDPFAPGVNRVIREALRSPHFAISSVRHVNNTLFVDVRRGERSRRSDLLALAAYAYVERQRFKLWKLGLRALFAALGIVYRGSHEPHRA